MSATNTTTNLGLSQFVNTDVPAWRQDYNGDMLKIDNAYTADISGATAETSADPSDYMKFYDVSATTNKKILISDLLKGAKVEDLTDTDITTPTDDDGFVYDATAQKWENKQITTKEQWQKNGAYNDLPMTLVNKVINGATATVNADGSVTIDTAGSATTGVANFVWDFPSFGKVGEKYRLVGCPSGGGVNTYYVNIYDNGWSDDTKDYGNGNTFTLGTGITQAVISIRSGVTIDHLTFKPMITTDLNATYDDFVPYAKTNRQLTEFTQGLDNLLLSPNTNDAMASSVASTRTAVFSGNGSAYTGTLPNGNYRYGIFISIPRNVTGRVLLAFAPGQGIAMNYYTGSTWDGWHSINIDS